MNREVLQHIDVEEVVVSEDDFLSVYGARAHNLKNIDIRIPSHKLVVITGLSGSGKSSLAFDTIYAEGQRRYMETFSAYARQFIGNLERPDVDRITGLSPVISIEQKTVSKNPRSTVGTVTEIYDFLRLLYARVADAYSVASGKKMVSYTDEQIEALVSKQFDGERILILAPLVRGRKGHYRELFEHIRKQGFLKVRVDGEIKELIMGMQTDRYKIHDIEVVIDQMSVDEKGRGRLKKSLLTAMRHGKGSVSIVNYDTGVVRHYSRSLICVDTGISYPAPEPNTFSFNSPYGACSKCNGLGVISEIDLKKIIPDKKLSIKNGGIIPVGTYKNSWIFRQIEAICLKYGLSMDTPLSDFPEEAIDNLLYGTNEVLNITNEYIGVTSTYVVNFEGIVNFIKQQDIEAASPGVRRWASRFMNEVVCPECNGARLKSESLSFKIKGKTIADLARMEVPQLRLWLSGVTKTLEMNKKVVAHEIIREIDTRIGFLLDVGIDYLNLNRPARSLSGGEGQRIRLATQIGTRLTGVLYILDEPSIGLHQRDNIKLINALKELRDAGNSVIVVEHDEEMMRSADYVVDIGPGAGRLGGHIVAQGTPNEMEQCHTVTCQYLSGERSIPLPKTRRAGNGLSIELLRASGNNLKNISLTVPLGIFICVTGVSGSGKSSLINQTLYPILSAKLHRSLKKPLSYEAIHGIEHIDKVIEIDQSPIGRTPRSNPATYTGVFDEIRKLYHQLPESKIRGYKPGRFSFNVKGGRCETCKGAGVKVIEMNFLPDVNVICETCGGKRYNRDTLEVRFKGKSINDVLNMTINRAVEFFENIPLILRKLKTLQKVGLGYLTLGQQSTTLSGGEAQRVKLATELSKRDTGKTFYILDEPTTGLHFEDIRVLLEVLNALVDKGNTVLVIEHNMDVIKVADYIIDIGPEGGNKGGEIVALGTPEQVVKVKNSYTGDFLGKLID
ncbi:MAG: excinuclease ABC subunit UvrA [Bacteroidales bacterium]|nr:excinuclease ABC subunit UvrA [Bacteroidales bacterium]